MFIAQAVGVEEQPAVGEEEQKEEQQAVGEEEQKEQQGQQDTQKEEQAVDGPAISTSI